MCLAKAFLKDNDERELVLEDVALIEIDDETLRLSTIFGEQKELQGVIKEVNFEDSSVILARPSRSGGK